MSGYPTTDTFSSLVDEVITSLEGFTLMTDQPYSLTGNITNTATSVPTDATSIGRGVIEIDEELIYVTSNSSGTLTVPAWGRGWKGTTKAAHTSGACVFVSPVYPRSVVSREVNNSIRSVFPDLFAVKTVDVVGSSTRWQYELPADCERILSVEWRWDTISGWNPVTDWELTASAYATDFPTSGKFISITEAIPVSAKIHITYAAAPTLLTNAADTYASTTGLPASSRDVIVLGAASRLLPWVDTGRTPAETVPSDMTDQQRPIGSAVQLARELRTRYQERLSKERDALYSKYPIRAHRIRG